MDPYALLRAPDLDCRVWEFMSTVGTPDSRRARVGNGQLMSTLHLPRAGALATLGWMVSLAVAGAFAPIGAAQPVQTVRLYTIDCGSLYFRDLTSLSDAGDYDGKSGTLADPCFLVRDPKGNLLWDTGLPQVKSNRDAPMRLQPAVPVANQLAVIGLRPSDVTYLAFSHLHFDHTGGANAFAASTWILNRRELAWALHEAAPGLVDLKSFSAYGHAHKVMIEGDYDVFGDGLVRILAAPGHTPGHEVLMVRLAHSGPVILGGDLYHLRLDRENRLVPPFNTSRAETLASMDRIEHLVRHFGARLIIQHDPQDFKSLPRFPDWLQ